MNTKQFHTIITQQLSDEYDITNLNIYFKFGSLIGTYVVSGLFKKGNVEIQVKRKEFLMLKNIISFIKSINYETM